MERELKKVNDLIELETKNLITLLGKVNIEYIDLLSYHYRFNDLVNRRERIESKIFEQRINK